LSGLAEWRGFLFGFGRLHTIRQNDIAKQQKIVPQKYVYQSMGTACAPEKDSFILSDGQPCYVSVQDK
jgi:hypothetical protein